MDSKYSDPPSAKVLDEGYNQTYIILEQSSNSRGEIDKDGDSKNERRDDQNNNAERENHHEVLFRCGNWCYKGLVQFNDLKINLEDVPIVIPTLQRQQGSLRYFCTAKR